MLFPPSPALSACDSLDGIDDLDAFLANQGSLSHFPTPPLKKDPIVQTIEVVDSDTETNSSPDFVHIATILAEEASIDLVSTPEDIESIRRAVIRAELPLEILALTYNIIAGLHDRVLALGTFTDTPADLLVVAAMSLAVSYTNDHPPRTFWWSHRVCDCTWTTKRIDKTILKLFATLDFQLHQYSSLDRIQQVISILSGPPEPEPLFFDAQTIFEVQPLTPEKQPLQLHIEGTNACWGYGQLTPDATPPPSAHPGHNMPLMRFLPLL